MNKRQRSSKYSNNRTYFNLAVTIIMMLLVFLVVLDACVPRKYRLISGEKSKYDITAPYDMINEIATEKNASDAAAAIGKVYSKDPEKVKAITEKAQNFIRMVSNERKLLEEALELDGTDKNVEHLRDNAITRLADRSLEFGAPLSREQALSILTDSSQEQLDIYLNDLLSRIETYADMEISIDNINNRILSLQRSIQSVYANQNLKNMGVSFASSVLIVNMNEDKLKTEAKQREVYLTNLERKIIVQKGTRVLNIDEHVSVEKLNFLMDYGLIEDGKVNALPSVKVAIVVSIVSLLFYVFINNYCRKILTTNRQVLLVASIILVVLFTCRLLYPVHNHAMPIFIAPILISYLLGLSVAVAANAYLVIVISMFSGMDMNIILIYIICGTTVSFLIYNTAQRGKFTIAGVILSIETVLLYIAMNGSFVAITEHYTDVIVLTLITLSSSLLSLGLVAILEGLFNTATPLRLIELSSGNMQILKKLSFEAPGTHHHSLMVSYMAETAASEIGANPFLAKAGALYHDVGKLKSPELFTENQNGFNPHDQLPPEESGKIIVSHVADGVEICEKYKLPQQIIDIVREHHGDTTVAYFYDKAMKAYGKENVDIKDYRYPGPKPSSKESVIVMLADSCEAAVRSTGLKQEEEIAEWVHKIVKNKFNDGQLEKSNISIRDINRISKSFIRVLSGYYHSRVKYPDETKQTEESERIENLQNAIRGMHNDQEEPREHTQKAIEGYVLTASAIKRLEATTKPFEGKEELQTDKTTVQNDMEQMPSNAIEIQQDKTKRKQNWSDE